MLYGDDQDADARNDPEKLAKLEWAFKERYLGAE